MMLKQFFKLLSAIFIGLVIAIWMIQNNTEVELAIAKKLVSELEETWNVKIQAEHPRVNLFTCSLYLNNGCVTYLKKDDCYWEFSRCKIHLSLIDFLLKRKFCLYFTFDNIKAHSKLTDNKPDIMAHIREMFLKKPSGISASAKSISLNNLNLEISDNLHKLQALISGCFNIKKDQSATEINGKSSWQGTISINDAQIRIDDKLLAQQISTTANFSKIKKNSTWLVQVSNIIKCLLLNPTQVYTISGIWDQERGFLTVKNIPSSFELGINYIDEKIKVDGKVPLELVVKLVNFFRSESSDLRVSDLSRVVLDGDCKLDLNWVISDSCLDQESSVVIENFKIENLLFKKITLMMKESSTERLVADVDILYSNLQFTGILEWDRIKEQGRLRLLNKKHIKILKDVSVGQFGSSDYLINPKNFLLELRFNKIFNICGNYRLNILNQLKNKRLKHSGNLGFTDNLLRIKGVTKKGSYFLIFQLLPKLCLLKWLYQINDKKIIDLQIKDAKSKILEGKVHFALIRPFLNQNIKNLILGQNCIFNLSLDQSDLSNLHGKLTLVDGKFYIPESRNLIENIQTDFEINIPSKIVLNNTKLGFFKGEVSSPRTVIQFDENVKISYIHIPLQVNDLLINWRKNLLAIIYGNILLKTIDDHFKITAQLVAKKSLLKENIFSIPEGSIFPIPMRIPFLQDRDFDFDINILSEHPIKAKTPSLETDASFNLKIQYQKNKNIFRLPKLTGTVKLDRGYIKFLQAKLFIEYGKIEFISNQMNDPIIDLIARSRVNKYQITLQATGSLQKPIILLESNPELTEEQILGLLLSGSEGAKLQTDLLAMLEQNLHDMILGSRKTSSRATSFFEKLTRPLKYIQVTPDFTDQSGRGGIRGTLSINVSDQVRAQIQKNFNLQEDFSAQVEYLLSDDINIKAIKDQRGELGAEVELRLKL